MQLTRNKIIILSCLFLLFIFINNFFWLRFDNLPQGVDSSWHLIDSVKFNAALENIIENNNSFAEISREIFYLFAFPFQGHVLHWPPLIYFIVSLLSPGPLSIFGLRLGLNFVFYFIILLSTYFLGKKLFSRKVGFLAAFLTGIYPVIIGLSRQFEFDFPLIAFTALLFALLIYTDYLQKRSFSFLFGLVLGLGLLVKLQILFFIMPAFLAVLATSFKKNKEKTGLLLFNNMTIFFLGFIFFCLYWSYHWQALAENIYCNFFSAYPSFNISNLMRFKEKVVLDNLTFNKFPFFSMRNLSFYSLQFVNHLSLPFFVLFLSSVIVIICRKIKPGVFLVFSIATPIIILTFISVRWGRFSTPVLPLIAVCSAWLVYQCRNHFLRKLFIALSVIYGVSLVFVNSWLIPYRSSQPFFYPRITEPIYIYPPRLAEVDDILTKSGILLQIREAISNNQSISIGYSKSYEPKQAALLLHFYFQRYLFDGLKIYRDDQLNPFICDYALIGNRQLKKGKYLLTNYKTLYFSPQLIILKKID
jgi:4-amino-4-deoxy-L-arabinose transferase-like glycosyltransferase